MRQGALWPLPREEALAVVASAALFTLAFPPFRLILPALLCLAPFAVAVARAADGADAVRSGARIGFWFGVLAYGASTYWIAGALALLTRFALAGFVAIVVAAGILLAACGAALVALRRLARWPMALCLPLAWVALEVLLTNLPQLAFPWLPLGLAAAPYPVLAQFADVSGVRGLSFVFAVVNGLAADAWLVRADRPRIVRRVVAVALLLAMIVGYGAWRMHTVVTRPLTAVAIVQPNIPQGTKWRASERDGHVATLSRLTRTLPALGDVSLIVWPEAAFTDVLQRRPEWRDTVRALVREGGAPLLFGTPERSTGADGRTRFYNAAMITDEAGDIMPLAHRKMDLVPMVERVPFVEARGFGDSALFGGYTPGHMALFDHAAGRIGTLICFESVFAGRAREIRRRGGDLIVNVTNDAWFGATLAPHQHAAHLTLRAIENRVGVVRSANSGFSQYLDPLGRVHGRTNLFEPAVRRLDVETTSVITPYVRLGDWVGSLAAAGTLLGVIVAMLRAAAGARATATAARIRTMIRQA